MTYEWTALKCKYLFLKAVPNTSLIKFFGYLVIKWLSPYHFQLTYTARSSENWTKRSTQSSNTSSHYMYHIRYNLQHVPAGAGNDLCNSWICSKPGEQVTEYYFRFKAPPGTTSHSITTHTPSGQRNCASWASQPQKSVTLLPCPGGRTTKSTKDMRWHWKKKKKKTIWSSCLEIADSAQFI